MQRILITVVSDLMVTKSENVEIYHLCQTFILWNRERRKSIACIHINYLLKGKLNIPRHKIISIYGPDFTENIFYRILLRRRLHKNWTKIKPTIRKTCYNYFFFNLRCVCRLNRSEFWTFKKHHKETLFPFLLNIFQRRELH